MLEYCLIKISSLVSTCAVFQLEGCCKTGGTTYFIYKGNIHKTVSKRSQNFITNIIEFNVSRRFLAELFRGMLFKWKGENKKSHQK